MVWSSPAALGARGRRVGMVSVRRIRLADVAGRTMGPPKLAELTGRPNGSDVGSSLGVGARSPSRGPFGPSIIASKSRPRGAESEISTLASRFPRDPDHLVESSVAGHPLTARHEPQRSGPIWIRAEFLQDLVA